MRHLSESTKEATGRATPDGRLKPCCTELRKFGWHSTPPSVCLSYPAAIGTLEPVRAARLVVESLLRIESHPNGSPAP